MTAELKVHSQKWEKGIVRVIAGGSLSFRTADGLERELQRWFEKECYTFIVDLGGVEELTSAGAVALVASARVAEQRGGRIVLARPSLAATRTLEYMGLFPLFHVVLDPKDLLLQ